LLLDEPFSALDSYLKWQIEPQFLEMLSGYKGVVVFVSHDRDEAYRFCDEIAIMNQGSIECLDDKETVFRRPRTVAAARVTGCKNIGIAKKRGEYLIEAADWGILLNTQEKVEDDIQYVGIRAHYFKKADPEEANAMRIRVLGVSETPFAVTVLFENADRAGGIESAQLRWEIDREKWESIKQEGIPEYLEFPPGQLLALK